LNELPPAGGTAPGEPDKLKTVVLLRRARAGDDRARGALLQRYRPVLVRWAHGRLPVHARDSLDTEDIVQNTLVRALTHLDGFEPRHDGAFLGYLCQIALNLIRDKIREVGRRPLRVELGDDHPDLGPSPLDHAIGRDNVRRYEDALARLSEDHRVSVRLRLELQYSYAEIANAMGRPTENAARLLVQRAMKRLAREMHERRRA
jgi:RNA polymerase sigma factor (sigma-70 family)